MSNEVIRWTLDTFPNNSNINQNVNQNVNPVGEWELNEKGLDNTYPPVETQPMETSIASSIDTFNQFIEDVKEGGLFYAFYGKPFPEVMGEFLKETALAIYKFIISNGHYFFLFPALALLICTFFVGRNQYTKWIVPLFFGFFISRVLYYAAQ